jgi:hypothetical protein
MQRRARLGASLATALLLAGCGGGGGAGASSAPPTRQFAAIADTICANANADIAALPAPADTLRSQALAARREVSIVRTELSQLSQLRAPASQEARFLAALAITRRETALVTRLSAAVRAGDAARVTTLALRARAVVASSQTAMTALGLAACAREAQPRGSP